MLNSLQYVQDGMWDVKAATRLQGVRDADESQKHTYLIPSGDILAQTQAMTALSIAYTPTGVNCCHWPPPL